MNCLSEHSQVLLLFFRRSLETGSKSELEWHISAFAVLVRSVVDIFPSFSLSFPSVSQCLLLYDLDERDKVRPCEGMLNRTDADCA